MDYTGLPSAGVLDMRPTDDKLKNYVCILCGGELSIYNPYCDRQSENAAGPPITATRQNPRTMNRDAIFQRHAAL